MANELLTSAEMQRADRLAVEAGSFDGFRLMQNAGAAVAAEILRRFSEMQTIHVLCGPGNNGGDGYVVARILHESGCMVRVWREGMPKKGGDAERAAKACPVEPRSLAEFEPNLEAVIVDALFGAGLARGIEGEAAEAIAKLAKVEAQVVAIDVPSGISADTGQVLGTAASAALTVTFFRKKPGHLLEPGRSYCGEVVVADIGIPSSVLAAIKPRWVENGPTVWRDALPLLSRGTHKYARGHVAVLSGGPSSTGAARLAAMGAARVGAGAVTLLSPAAALLVNAAHLTSTILRRLETADELAEFAELRKPQGWVLGPGFGDDRRLRELTLAVLKLGGNAGVVMDADIFSASRAEPATFFTAIRDSEARAVLTPHEGEFRRLFPDLGEDKSLSKLERARAAAERSGATVVLKGPDTVIASPDGRAAINGNGTPLLATAGSGDVLAGLVAGLLAQGMPAFETACAAVWMHAEAARRFGPGLIAEDLPAEIPAVLRELAG